MQDGRLHQNPPRHQARRQPGQSHSPDRGLSYLLKPCGLACTQLCGLFFHHFLAVLQAESRIYPPKVIFSSQKIFFRLVANSENGFKRCQRRGISPKFKKSINCTDCRGWSETCPPNNGGACQGLLLAKAHRTQRMVTHVTYSV